MAEITLDVCRLQAFAEVGYQVANGGGAHGAMAALRRLVPLDAYEFVAYDPATRRHHSVVSDGHTRIDRDAAEEYAGLEAYRTAMATRAPVGMPEQPGTERYFRRHLAPYGWRAGLTAPLFLSEGRYTGLLHLATRDDFPRLTGELVAAASPMLAHITDLSRCVIDPVGLPPDYRVIAFDRRGVRREVPGRETSAALREPAVEECARAFIDSRELSRHGLWLDRDGRWHEMRLLRAGVGFQGTLQGAIAAERPCSLPYELTGREVDVLTRVAAGDSNPQIAASLVLSVRTVTTHLEHIFAKLGCDSRTRLTTKALAEGLCRLDA